MTEHYLNRMVDVCNTGEVFGNVLESTKLNILKNTHEIINSVI